jgi:phosphate transport system substrate-binding protein
MITLAAAPARADVDLTETGSTLLNPLFRIWTAEYMRTHSGVHITTGATGSGEGIKEAISGVVHIGASDAYMSDAQARRYPQIINVPMAISAVTVNYNLPGFSTASLKLSGPVLAGIYTGKIREWDDKAIASLNPDVSLPHHDIIPVYREDGSGDTFIFTQYLTFTTPWWENDVGFGTEITWPPVPGSASAKENSGVLQKIKETPLLAHLYRRQLSHRDCECPTRHRPGEELFGGVSAADAGVGAGGGGLAHPSNAAR